MNKKSLKYGSLSIFMVLVVVAVVILVNYALTMLQQKKIINPSFDITANKVYSIGDTSKKILNNLKKDVDIYVISDKSAFEATLNYSGNQSIQTENVGTQVVRILGEYQTNSSHVKVTYMDPDKNPGFVSSLDPTKEKNVARNSIVIKCGSKIKVTSPNAMINVSSDQTRQTANVQFTGENTITGAIKSVSSDTTHIVYFVNNHGELKADSNFKSLSEFLTNNNFEIKSLDLSSGVTVPNDAEILIFPSPKSDLLPTEGKKLSDYMDNGGNCVFLFDYLESSTKFSGFESLLKDYNVGINYDKVKETDQGRYAEKNPYSALVEIPGNSIISQESRAIFVNSRSLSTLKNQKDKLTVTSLVKTGPKAVSEPVDKSGKTLNGPFDIGLAVEDKRGQKPSKIVVLGNSSFLSDTSLQKWGDYSGAQIFSSSIYWMSNVKDDVKIESKAPNTQNLTITSDTQFYMLCLALFVFVLLIFGTGMFVWTRRKHL